MSTALGDLFEGGSDSEDESEFFRYAADDDDQDHEKERKKISSLASQVERGRSVNDAGTRDD